MTFTLALLLASTLLAPPSGTPGCQDPGSRKPGSQDPKPGTQPKQPPRFVPLPIPRGLAKHRGDKKITIDGALDDWPKVIPLSLRDPRQVSGTALGSYRGTRDISGQMYLVWDEQFLYLALQVIDDWHHGIHKRVPRITPPDNATITFDPKRDTRSFGDDPGRVDDRTFFFADIEENDGKLILWNRRTGSRSMTKDATCRVDRRENDKITIYEARIPWREILPRGQLPRDRTVFDMQIVLNDFDAFNDRLPQTRVGWNFGMGPQVKPGVWGSVMLLKKFAARDPVPAFPAPPMGGDRLPGRKSWVDLYAKLSAHKPAFSTADTPDPAMVAGPERHKHLTTLEGYLRAFPRISNLDYHHRIQRRMLRETAGISQNGLPFYWDYAMRDLMRRIVAAPPKGTIRVFRLPQGGWYVRSDTVNFAINPCGRGMERIYLRGGIDFVLLNRPTEVTRRHDPLLVRMAASKPKRQFLTHLSFYLPGAKPGSMPLTKPFQDYGMGGLKRITPFCNVGKDGKVSLSMGYLVEWADGRTLVCADLAASSKSIKKLGVAPDVLILSGMYADEDMKSYVRDFGPRFTFLDDVLVAREYHGARVSLEKALQIQQNLKPHASALLAPGEYLDIPKR